MSLAIHCAAILTIVVASAATSPVQPHHAPFDRVALVVPALERPVVEVRSRVAPIQRERAKRFVAPVQTRIPAEEPRLQAPAIQIAETRNPPVAMPARIPQLDPPKAPLRTDTFSKVAATPTPLDKPILSTAIGGFASSAPEPASTGKSEPIQTGSFGGSSSDSGSGYASNRASSLHRSVRPAGDLGFENVAVPARTDPIRVLRTADFGNSVLASAQIPAARRSAAVLTREVEILSKPRPQYTDEARRRQIEGEVALEVVLAASGELRVIRILRGLGYGLDESAIRAAAGIRFRPAESSGVATDSTAIVRIQFQLAY